MNRQWLAGKILRSALGVFFLALLCLDSPAWGISSETAKLLPSDGQDYDYAGYSLSLSSKRALIGAPSTHSAGEPGSAHVYRYDDGTESWIEKAELVPLDGDVGDRFGAAVSLDGNVALIGAPEDNDGGALSGSAYIFRYDEKTDTWMEEAKLLPADGASGDFFGYSLSLAGDVALIGAPYADDDGPDSGSAYIFRHDRKTGLWTEETKLRPSFCGDDAYFGFSLSTTGNRALIGSPGLDVWPTIDCGSVFVFDYDRASMQWLETEVISESPFVEESRFGYSVSLFEDRALIGAPDTLNTMFRSGAAYVFKYHAPAYSWEKEAKLVASDGEVDDRFGFSVSLFGQRALIGAPLDDDSGSESGSAHLFQNNGGGWIYRDKLTASDGDSNDSLGHSVAIEGKCYLAGAPGDSHNGPLSGSAYVFGIPEDLFIFVPGDYPTIQEAIGKAFDGYTIFVAPGTYVENIDFLGKAIDVRASHGPNLTVIDGGQAGPAVTFSNPGRPGALLEGFTITNGAADNGGGVFCTGDQFFLSYNVIVGNTASTGGGVYWDGQIVLTGNVIWGNSATSGNGGGIYCQRVSSTAAEISGNWIVENTAAQSGGGIYFIDCFPPLVNNVIAGNSAGYGGGIFLYHFFFDDLFIMNNTITSNSATSSGGGIWVRDQASGEITNTIVWDNQAPVDPEIYLGTTTVETTYCDVKGGWPGTGNIDADPLFHDPANSDFHLTWDSPCRDAGTNTAPGLPDVDFEADQRPAFGTADIGYDEYHYHLYHWGDVVPGDQIELRIVGSPSYPVTLYLGAGFVSPPFPTQHGDLYIQWPPLWQGSIGTVPGNGILVLDVTVPTAWSRSEIHPLQALVGSWGSAWTLFTNLDLLIVE